MQRNDRRFAGGQHRRGINDDDAVGVAGTQKV
jgi:hypothetical protein